MIAFMLKCVLFLFISFALIANGKNASCPLDHLCIALDESSSMEHQYEDVRETIKTTIDLLYRLVDDVFISAVGFGDYYRTIFPPSQTRRRGRFSNQRPLPNRGNSNMYAGLKQCYEYVASKPGNKVILLATDGYDSGSPSAQELVQSMRGSGVSVVTAAFGPYVNTTYLMQVADPKQFFISIMGNDYAALAARLMSTICAAAAYNRDVCQDAYTECGFYFQGHQFVPSYSIGGPPDISFTDRIISRNEHIEHVDMSEVPEFLNADGTTIPIDTVGSPPFTRSHFKPFNYNLSSASSGIGHQTFQGNQKSFASNRCVRIYFSHYQKIQSGRGGKRTTNVNVNRLDNKCVVFKTV